MSFRRKTYPEVAESLLNRLLGGVSGEAHPYPPAKATREPYRHALERPPVDRITAVWGAHNGETFRFAPDADYLLSADGAELEWKAGGARFKGIRRNNDAHQIEEVGAKLRGMMPWIGKNKLVDKERN